ncbi:MAG: VOC family protein [Rhodothermales bacterium]|nr:VOC family protein [Rhodothermales bacterium]
MSDSFLAAIPMLHVVEVEEALEFYCGRLGFRELWRYQPHADSVNPSYVGIRRGGIILHLSSFSGDGIPGGVAVLFLEDVDGYCAELTEAGIDVGAGPVNQTWGNRECYIRDPSGNQLRLTQVLQKNA